uniref:SLIT and NTRK-like family, member 3a n=1 Tax=Cyprinus carpio TaxID=7962 RepID=A0A8C2FJ74_CYPCA
MLWFTLLSTIALGWTTPIPLLDENSMRRLYFNSFLHLNNAVSLNLGNNALQDIHVGAFNGLSILKKLFLHENKLEVFRNDTFMGLESLEYLQADYNVIKRIESGAFRNLHKLRVLILNDNLIPVLPSLLFRSVSLTHLDLRGNQENPWNCVCDIVQLKTWLERIPYTALVGDITSELEAKHGIPRLPFNNENVWPTKPSSMLSSFHNTASSVEYRERHVKPTKRQRPTKTPPTPRSIYPGQNQPPVAAYQT